MGNRAPSRNLTLVLVEGWWWLQLVVGERRLLVTRKAKAGDCFNPHR